MISNSIAVTLQNDTLSLRSDEGHIFNGFELKVMKTFSVFADFIARKLLLPKLKRVVQLQADLNLKFNSIIPVIEQSQDEPIIDEDFQLRDSIDRLKTVLSSFREDCKNFEKELEISPSLVNGLRIAQKVSQELFASATALQWAIAEHDADLSGRREGFTANSAREAEDILNKILAAA